MYHYYGSTGFTCVLVYLVTAVNKPPKIGGTGVTNLTTEGGTGVYTVSAGNSCGVETSADL